MMIGSNPEGSHPIASMHIHRALKRGAKLIVIDPVKTEMAQRADIHIQLPPEYNIPILNALLYTIIEEGLTDKEFIDNFTTGFAYPRETVQEYSPEKVEKMTGVPAKDLREAARIYATTKPAAITHGMGITHFNHGTANVCAISNLMLATGNIGELGSGDYPLRGQQNVQGSTDIGVLAHKYPNTGDVTDPKQIEYFEKFWNVTGLSREVGIMKNKVPDAILSGKVKVFYTVGENPVISEPNTNHFLKGIAAVEMYIVQDLFLTETSQKADIILPAVSGAEKTGCYINAERRVQLNHRNIEPKGDVKTDGEITCELAKRLGAQGFDYANSEEVWEEIRKMDPKRFGGMSYKRIVENEGLCWPCPTEDHPGTPSLYLDKVFLTPDGKAKFIPVAFTDKKEKMQDLRVEMARKLKAPEGYLCLTGALDEPTDEKYPLNLITTRKVYQYTVGTMTRRSRLLESGAYKNGATAELHPETAKQYGLKDGDFIEAYSRYGQIAVIAEENSNIRPGSVQMTFHYWESSANELTSNGTDYITGTPTFRSAIGLRKISEEEYKRIRAEKLEKFQSEKIIFDNVAH